MGRAKFLPTLLRDRVNFSTGNERIKLPGERTNSPTLHKQNPNCLRGYQSYFNRSIISM